ECLTPRPLFRKRPGSMPGYASILQTGGPHHEPIRGLHRRSPEVHFGWNPGVVVPRRPPAPLYDPAAWSPVSPGPCPDTIQKLLQWSAAATAVVKKDGCYAHGSSGLLLSDRGC